MGATHYPRISCIRRPHLVALVALGLATAGSRAPAQTVWTVTAWNGIPSAIAAASPGDVLLLVGGTTYEPFLLDRGLSIRGNGATIGGGPSSPSGAVVVDIPAGQVAHLDDIRFTYGYSPFGSLGCPVSVRGNVRIERCSFLSRNSATALTATAADLWIAASSITSGGTTSSGLAFSATDSRVTLRDCTVTGSNAGCHPSAGCSWSFAAQPAVVLGNGSLHAERTTLLGGNHTTTGFAGDGAAALQNAGGSLWLGDCMLVGGSSVAGAGATALVHNAAGAAALRQTQLVGGLPGGSGALGPIDPNAPLVRLELQPVWTRGATSTLTGRGDANAPFGLWIAPDLAPATIPLVVEPVWALTGANLTVAVLDAAGATTWSFAVPNLPALLHLPVWCQAVAGTSLPLRASSLAGGLVR